MTAAQKRSAETIMREIDSAIKGIDDLKTGIDYAIARKATVPLDKERMARMKHVLRLAQRKHQELLREYGPAKREEDRKASQVRAIRFETAFLDACRERLDKADFKDIWNAAHDTYNRQEQA